MHERGSTLTDQAWQLAQRLHGPHCPTGLGGCGCRRRAAVHGARVVGAAAHPDPAAGRRPQDSSIPSTHVSRHPLPFPFPVCAGRRHGARVVGAAAHPDQAADPGPQGPPGPLDQQGRGRRRHASAGEHRRCGGLTGKGSRGGQG
eukprot:365704-Chlamydomonas_euryale.AAC.11